MEAIVTQREVFDVTNTNLALCFAGFLWVGESQNIHNQYSLEFLPHCDRMKQCSSGVLLLL